MDSISYSPNPHIAFPLGFGNMKSQSAIADICREDENVCLTVRIEAIGYDDYTKKEAERGGSLDRIFPGITKSMGRLPNEDAFWLYSVTAFETTTAKTSSLLLLPASDGEIKTEWFDDFHAALSYCSYQYGLSPSDFKKGG